jgi:hypothetical protein
MPRQFRRIDPNEANRLRQIDATHRIAIDRLRHFAND